MVTRDPGVKGSQLLPRRWVVERTFARLGKCRRLVRDYEHLVEFSKAWLYLALSRLYLQRLAYFAD